MLIIFFFDAHNNFFLMPMPWTSSEGSEDVYNIFRILHSLQPLKIQLFHVSLVILRFCKKLGRSQWEFDLLTVF